MRIPSGTSTRYLYFVAVDATDLKTREPGLSSFTVYRSRNGAAEVAYTTPTITEIDATNMPGVYALLIDEDTTLDSGHDSQEYCVHITHAGMAPVTRTFELYRPKITEGETVTASSSSLPAIATAIDNVDNFVDTEIGALQTDVTAIRAKTDNLPSDPADASVVAGLIAAVEAKVDTVDTVVDAILVDTGTTLQAELDGIQADTEDIQTRLPAALVSGRMDSSVGAMAASTLTANALAADAVAEIAAALGLYSISGTADSGTTTTMVDAARTEADADYWVGGVIQFTSGSIAGQSRFITDFDPATDTITFSPATTQAVGTNTYLILPAGGETALDAKLGAFTGTGVNTVLGFLRAMMRSDLDAPSDAGGTYDPHTDALQAIRDRMLVGGTTVRSTPLSALSASASASVSAGTLSLSSTGWLARLVADVRMEAAEPRVMATYTDTRLLQMLATNWAEVWTDLAVCADQPVLVRYAVDVVAGVSEYWLPPSVGEIIRVGRLNTETGLFDWELDTLSHYNPCGPGFEVKGNVLKLGSNWSEGWALTMEYIPNGEVSFHEGSGSFVDATTFQMEQSAAVGTFDRRPNAYGGFLLRVFRPAGIIEERLISASSEALNQLTITPGISTLPDPLGPYSYEVVPFQGNLIGKMLVLKTVLQILAATTNTKAYQLQTMEYRKVQRAAHLKVQHVLKRRPGRFRGDVAGNPYYGE